MPGQKTPEKNQKKLPTSYHTTTHRLKRTVRQERLRIPSDIFSQAPPSQSYQQIPDDSLELTLRSLPASRSLTFLENVNAGHPQADHLHLEDFSLDASSYSTQNNTPPSSPTQDFSYPAGLDPHDPRINGNLSAQVRASLFSRAVSSSASSSSSMGKQEKDMASSSYSIPSSWNQQPSTHSSRSSSEAEFYEPPTPVSSLSGSDNDKGKGQNLFQSRLRTK